MLRLLDSRVVALAARMVGLPTPHVAPGSDLTALLLSRHVTANERITIVGLSANWLPALVSRCGLAPPAHYDPPRRLRTRPGRVADYSRIRVVAPRAVHFSCGGFSTAGDAGSGYSGYRPSHRHRPLHWCELGIHRWCATTCASLDAAHWSGMAAPAQPRSEPVGTTLSDRQSGHFSYHVARAARNWRNRLTGLIPARLKVDLSGLAQIRTTTDSGRRRESGIYERWYNLAGWCVWVARQFNAESTERRRARREGRIGASRGGQRHHSIAGRFVAAAAIFQFSLHALRTLHC